MTKHELESLGLSDAKLEAEFVRLFPAEGVQSIENDQERRDLFEVVTARWYDPVERVAD